MQDIRTAVIVDVDGTLCDVTTALHHLTGPRRDFEAFHQATALCPPTPHVVEWCRQQHAAGHAVVVVTARKYQHEALTTAWLDEHLPVPYVGPLMRGDHDDRDDTEVKRQIHEVITEDMGFDAVVAAIDDRPRVIALWRSMGIPTTVVHRPDWAESGEHYDPADLEVLAGPHFDGDAMIAAIDLVGRTGATGFEFGYLHDDVPIELADWYAHAQYRGARVTSEHHRGPVEAAEGLARRLLSGGLCMHCSRTVVLGGAGRQRCRWTRVGRTWKPGCE